MIVFDTETTGLLKPMGVPLSAQPEIIEVALVVLHDDTLKELDSFTQLVKPRILPLDKKIVEITGLSDEDLVNADPFAACYPALCRQFIGETIMVAHNVAFDRGMLFNELARMDLHYKFPWPSQHVCTVELNLPHFGRRIKQDEMYGHYIGTKPVGAHRALNDVRNLADVLRAMRTQGRF